MNPISPETREKISRAKMGHPVSRETRVKLSAAFRGRRLNPDHCQKISLGLRGSKNPNWRGGRRSTPGGYVAVYSPDHPFANRGYVLEHRLVMEVHLGRMLLPKEVVHHINGIPDDNRIENLALFSSNGNHLHHHAIGRHP